MKIKTLLLACTVFLLGVFSLVGVATFFASHQTNQIAQQGTLAETIITEAFELNNFAQDFLRDFADRPRVQWAAQYAAIEKTLANPDLQQAPSDAYIVGLQQQLEGMNVSFSAIVEEARQAAPNQKLIDQLSADLLLKTRRFIAETDRLADEAFAQRSATRQRNDHLIAMVLISLALISVAVLLLLYHRIIEPIVRLQRGAEIVAKGDLKYKLRNNVHDEVGALSRAFDRMTDELSRSYDSLEAKVAERTQALRELTIKNEQMLKSIGDGVVAIDSNWEIILWNDAAERITGWSNAEAIGKPLRSILRFVREHDRKENILFISDAMMSGKVRYMENHTVLIRKDNTEVPVGDSAAPIFDTDGKIIGVIIVFRDITAERDASLVRSSFAYASHQLRTPVTEALWNIESAKGEVKTASVKEKLEIALHSMQSVRKLVTELMDVSEIDQKIIVPKIKAVDVKSIFTAVDASTSAKSQEQQVAVTFAKTTKLPKIQTDAKLLRRALYEIIDNAITYSKAKAKVEVSASMSEDQIVFEVKDHGIGIPNEQQGVVFTKFFRGSNIPTNSIGAGLGMYICREYARLLNGNVWFHSEQGKGTTVFLSLPHKSH